MAETAFAAFRTREKVTFDQRELGPLDRLDHQLCDPVAPSDLIVLRRVSIDQEDRQLTAVTGVDEPRRVETRHAVAERQPTPWQDKSAEADRQGQHHAGRDEGPPPAGGDVGVLACVEIGAGVS